MGRSTKVFLEKVREIQHDDNTVIPLTAVEATWRKVYKVQYNMKEKITISVDKARKHIREEGIYCYKYNYCLEKCVQNFKHFEAKIVLSSDN